MKSILALVLAVAASALVLAPVSSEAGARYRSGYSAPACKPYYVCTKVLSRRYECRWAKRSCGRSYSYRVVVTTYADVYSNGSRRVYTRVARA